MIPRTLYIDPGTAWTAWVIAERADPMQADALPLRVVDHDKIETGSLVDLPAHKVTRRTNKDGTEYVKDKERIVSRSDRVRVGAMLAAVAQRHGVTRVVMERVAHVFLRGASKGGDMKQAESAKQTALVEEKILDFMEAAGIEVVAVSRATWANRLRPMLGAKVVGAPAMSRAELLPVLQWGYADAWPKAADEHKRDCGGMSLWDVLPPLVSARKARAATARKRTSRPSGKRGPCGAIDKAKRKARRAALREERRPAREAAALAARAAMGCTCGLHRGRHRKDCALHVPSPAVVAKAARLASRLADRVAAREVRAAEAAEREAIREARAVERAKLKARNERLALGD